MSNNTDFVEFQSRLENQPQWSDEDDEIVICDNCRKPLTYGDSYIQTNYIICTDCVDNMLKYELIEALDISIIQI